MYSSYYGYDESTLFFTAILYIVIGIGVSCAWGYGVNRVIANKGYSDNWFWWGFFFGFIALIVALTKPECTYTTGNNYSMAQRNADTLNHGGWRCSCGRVNAAYVGTCACGRTKGGIESAQRAKKEEQTALGEVQKLEAIKQLKELLDSGAITQEEFNEKKKKFL